MGRFHALSFTVATVIHSTTNELENTLRNIGMFFWSIRNIGMFFWSISDRKLRDLSLQCFRRAALPIVGIGRYVRAIRQGWRELLLLLPGIRRRGLGPAEPLRAEPRDALLRLVVARCCD